MEPRTPLEIVNTYINLSETKAKQSPVKLLVLGMMAGAFIALGGASAAVASHGITNVGVARLSSAAVFPIGLLMIIFIGGELFTGDTMIVFGAYHKRISYLTYLKTIAIVYIGNFIGAALIAFFVVNSGQLNYSGKALGAYTIKVAIDKVSGEFSSFFFSGILCNILVCIGVLMGIAAKDAVGKFFCAYLPIFAFVVGGYEHCVANMFYIPAGMMAAANPEYLEEAVKIYGYTYEHLQRLNISSMIFNNLIPVTLGNMTAGILLVAFVLYKLHGKSCNDKG